MHDWRSIQMPTDGPSQEQKPGKTEKFQTEGLKLT